MTNEEMIEKFAINLIKNQKDLSAGLNKIIKDTLFGNNSEVHYDDEINKTKWKQLVVLTSNRSGNEFIGFLIRETSTMYYVARDRKDNIGEAWAKEYCQLIHLGKIKVTR